MNPYLVEVYRQLSDAEHRLDEVRRRRGLTAAEAAATAELSDAELTIALGRGDDVYLGTLGRYVAALGGRLELRAVFPEETVTLRRLPEDVPGQP